MITQRQFRDLVACLETGNEMPSLRDVTIDADTMIEADVGGYAELRLQRKRVKVASLLNMWKNGEITSFSVEIKTLFGVRRGCTHRCDDGAVQHEMCSETKEDIFHCTEALKGRCRS
jgi:hypothetical protein